MPAYLIARLDITDPEAAKTAYPRYVETAGPAYREHGARFLVRGGTAQPVDGDGRARNVVIAYPDMAAGRACFASETYQSARQYRVPVAIGEIVLVAGIAAAVSGAPAGEGRKGYWIARYDVRDPERHKRYVEAAAPAFEAYGATFLARGGEHVALEGQARTRNVLIEFPDVQHALDCFNSDTYQGAREHRLPVSEGEIVIVEGV